MTIVTAQGQGTLVAERRASVHQPKFKNATRETTAHEFTLRPPSGRAAKDPLNPVRHLDVSRCSASPQRVTLAGLVRESVSRRQYRGHARSMTRSDLPPIRTRFHERWPQRAFPPSSAFCGQRPAFLKCPRRGLEYHEIGRAPSGARPKTFDILAMRSRDRVAVPAVPITRRRQKTCQGSSP